VEQVFRGTIEKWSAFGGIEQDIARMGTKGPLISWRMFTQKVLNDKPVRLPDFQHDPNDLPSADVLAAYYEEQRRRFPGGGPFPCYETDSALIQAVAKKPNGIGYCLLFPSSERMKEVRLVPIAENEGDQAVEPIHDGRLAEEYPLQKTITIILHPDAPPSTGAFVEYATGPKAIKAIEQCGLWPARSSLDEATKKPREGSPTRRTP
jgi:ABC-type phosphate transport system substrate-binding protein